MPLYLIKITARREDSRISTIKDEVIQELPPDPHYWDAAAKILFKQMVDDGIFSPNADLRVNDGTPPRPETRLISRG